MPAENRYLDCKNENGRCGNLIHERAKIGEDEICTKSRAWAKNALPCLGCGILVPEQFGFRRNPELIRLHAEKKLENPKLAGAITVRIFFALVAVPDGRVCGACAKLFNAGFNPSVCPGRILGSEKGTSHKFFLDAEAFNSWWHQQREAARRGAMQKDDRLLAFVRAMLAGQRIEFSTHKFEGGVQL